MRLLALALSLSLLACRSRDESDPETWIRRLADRDAKIRVQAVQQLRKLKAKQAAREVLWRASERLETLKLSLS